MNRIELDLGSIEIFLNLSCWSGTDEVERGKVALPYLVTVGMLLII